MYTNVNLAAPVGVLLLLATGFLLFVAALALGYSLISKKFGLTKLLVVAAAVLIGSYLGVMLIFSIASSERVLVRGQEKHFCEIDCHLAYSITDVREIKTLGEGPGQISAAGTFRVVTIQTRFDETTTGRNRGDGQLYPNPRVLTVVDESGNKYFPSTSGQGVLENSHAAGTPITTPLQPSQTYTTTFVFDLPTNIRNPTLLIHEGDAITSLIIGHENSFLHKTTRFQI